MTSTKQVPDAWVQNQAMYAGQEQGFGDRGPHTGPDAQQMIPPMYQEPTVAVGQEQYPFPASNGPNAPPANGPQYPGANANMQQYAPPNAAPWQQTNAPTAFQDARPAPHIPQRPEQKPIARPVKIGFSVAGLCIIIGGLILVFVYFMAQGLPSASTPAANTTPISSPIAQAPTSTPTPRSSPTPTYPGQQYLDNAQTASSLTADKQPAQVTNTFAAGQKIYVTFAVHTRTSGAACLYWYLNGAKIFPYALAITPAMLHAASFATLSGAGSGYVEIYWASDTSCTDQQMAQRADFTVTR